MQNTTDDRAVKAGAGLTMLIVGGSLVAVSTLLIVVLLVISGFLTAPLLLLVTVAVAGLVILGLSITAAVLSRRA